LGAPVFPGPGCYVISVPGNEFLFANRLEVTDTSADPTVADAWLHFDGTCNPFNGGAPAEYQLALVSAPNFNDAVDKCDTVEPGTYDALSTDNFVVGGSPDIWQCRGGVRPGLCISKDAFGSMTYVGPIDTLDNALVHADPQPPIGFCATGLIGTATIVAETPSPDADALAVKKCQDLFGLRNAVNLYTDGYYLPAFNSVAHFDPLLLYRCE
jgi:hypothetical protein